MPPRKNPGPIVVLAGGISSRMTRSLDPSDPARTRAKAMTPVGSGGRPFLDYVLSNIAAAGHTESVLVTGERDESIRGYYGTGGRSRDFLPMQISWIVQRVPAGREKPLGTADALLTVLRSRPDWKGGTFTVCNSDNLYSRRALRLLAADGHRNALINYNRDALGFPPDRTGAFSVLMTDAAGCVTGIVEKPGPAEIAAATGPDGIVGVSMNIFRLSYDDIFPYLESVPMHPERLEKELPLAVGRLAAERPGSVYGIPLSERVPDLTQAGDIPEVSKYLEDCGEA